jgi:di/tricarboxylate transporter
LYEKENLKKECNSEKKKSLNPSIFTDSYKMQQALVISLIIGLIIVLYKDLIRPVIAFFIIALVLLITDTIDTKDFMAGFANEQILVVLILIMLSDVIQRTAVVDLAFQNVFKPSLSYRRFLALLGILVAPVSAFVNNTPLVAILMPYVYDWSKKKGIAPSKVLIPLSYLTILGGTITLVGTSTNLVVNGFVTDAGYESLGMFDFTLVGASVAVVGILYIVFIGPSLLPDRKDAISDFREKSREYVTETILTPKSALIGKTVEEAGLRKLKGLFLVEIIRGEERIAPVSPVQSLEANDKLIFAGETSTILDLIKTNNGIELPNSAKLSNSESMEVKEVVISSNSDLIGKIVKDTNFRGKYDSAIIAINRNGERITGKLGEVQLQSGDLLLLITGDDFENRASEEQDFYIISSVDKIHKMALYKTYTVLLGTVAAFVTSALGYLSLFESLLILMSLIAAMQIVRFNDIKRSFDVDMYLILVLALSFGKAIVNTGLDKEISGAMLEIVKPVGSNIAALAFVYLATNILAMMVTNKAAVAIMFPVALSTAKTLGIEPTPFFLAIAFAGCAEFMTPYGYQTNLMVYGPGGYKFRDYMKIGWGLSLTFFVVAVSLLGWMYDLW